MRLSVAFTGALSALFVSLAGCGRTEAPVTVPDQSAGQFTLAGQKSSPSIMLRPSQEAEPAITNHFTDYKSAMTCNAMSAIASSYLSSHETTRDETALLIRTFNDEIFMNSLIDAAQKAQTIPQKKRERYTQDIAEKIQRDYYSPAYLMQTVYNECGFYANASTRQNLTLKIDEFHTRQAQAVSLSLRPGI